MGLLSIFKRRTDGTSAAPASDTVDAVQRARMLARQRLIGAVVLVIIGIVGFPLVFETQPRPIPVDVPIEIPRKDGAPALTMPPRTATAPVATAASTAREPAAAAPDVITESREDAGREVAAATPPAVVVAPPSKPARPDMAKPEVKPEPRPTKPLAAAAEPRPEVKNSADAARARDLLDGKAGAAAPPAAAAAGRFVVQVGAFADAAQAHEARIKVEKLGMKTYTQVAATASGNRIRVRVGPFANRDEADKALAKARGAGLAGVVLTL